MGWAQFLSVGVHAGLIAVLVARYEAPPPAPAAVLIELDQTLPAPEPVAEAPPVPELPAAPEPETAVAEALPPEPPPVPDAPPPPAPEPLVAMAPPPPAKPRPPESAKRLPAAPAPPKAVAREPSAQLAAQPAPVPAAARPAGPPPDYLALLQARLARFKVYPRAAQLAREEGTVLLRFVVARDGAVVSWRIERGSGHEILDRQVATMIERAAPMPPMPDSVPGERLDVALPILFALR